MFKLGGDTVDAQGTGITSGLDAPRQGYEHAGVAHIYPKRKPPVPFGAQIRTAINKLKVDPQDYRPQIGRAHV